MFRLVEVPSPALRGRGAELALIASALDGVDTHGGAMVLSGGPGIGKSRLLGEAAALAAGRGISVLSATGVKSEASLPFSGLHALLRPVRDRIDELAPAHRVAIDGALGRGVGGPPEPFHVAMAVLDLLSDVANEAPLLVLVDDVHWLDRASTDVLAFVARRLQSDPIVLLAAECDGYPAALVDAGVPELALGPLEPTAAAGLLDAPGRTLSTAVRDRLLHQAEGNPLALIELPLAIDRPWRAFGSPGTVPLTARLEQAFAARVSDLPADTRLLLLVAALVDEGDVDEVLQVAAALEGCPVDAEALQPAAEAALIDLHLHTVRFRHPLTASAVRQSADVAQRRRVHEAVAADPGADPDRRAWHRAALVVGVHAEVAQELEEAGRRALRRGSIGDAHTAWRRAAELSEGGQRLRRLLTASELAHEIAQPEAAAELLQEAKQGELRPIDRARVTWLEGMSATMPLDVAGAATLIRAAGVADAAGDRELHVGLLWLLAQRTWWAGASDLVRGTLMKASFHWGGAAAADPRAFAIYAFADAVGHAQPVLERLRTVTAGGRHDTDALRCFGEAALVVGAFDLALPLCRDAVAGLRADGRPGHLTRALAVQGMVAAYQADWDQAVPAADEARRLAAELRRPEDVARAEAVIAMVAGMRGDLDAAERLSAGAEQLGLSLGFRGPIVLAQFGRITARLGAGRHGDAYATAQRLFDDADAAHHPVAASWFVGDYAEAASHVGCVAEATARVDRLRSAVGETPAILLELGLRHAAAVLADDDDAEARFREALGADLSRWPYPRARLLLAQGQWLRRQRRVAESRVPLRAARDAFDAIGCAAWSERARRELRASGESSRRRDPSAREQLTAQELQIAHLAAEGLTNRAIGERLYLSPRTISTHLYRLFPKLGVTARGELGAVLARAA